jgi:hypothetical protein
MCETCVFSVKNDLLHGLGVAFYKLVELCQLISLDRPIDIVYGRHLEINSTIDALTFP